MRFVRLASVALPLASALALSAPASAQNIRLELVEVTATTQYMSGPENWKYDVSQLTASWSPYWGGATYKVSMPQVIDASGAQATMTITGHAVGGDALSAQIGFLGEVEPQSQVTNHLVVSGAAEGTKTQTLPFTMTPRANYSEGYSPVMIMRLDGGPEFHFKYRVVRDAPVQPVSVAGNGLRLVLEEVTATTQYMSGPENWKYDVSQLTASWSPYWGGATYKVSMPQVIDASGAQATMTITGHAVGGDALSAQIGFLGEVEPQSQVTNHLVVSGAAEGTKTQTLPFTMTPRANYSEGYSPVMIMRLDGGPEFHFKYRVVRDGGR